LKEIARMRGESEYVFANAALLRRFIRVADCARKAVPIAEVPSRIRVVPSAIARISAWGSSVVLPLPGGRILFNWSRSGASLADWAAANGADSAVSGDTTRVMMSWFVNAGPTSGEKFTVALTKPWRAAYPIRSRSVFVTMLEAIVPSVRG